MKFGPQHVRLLGIDAPEKGQTCDDGRWHPGPLAKKALEDPSALPPRAANHQTNPGPVNHVVIGRLVMSVTGAQNLAVGWQGPVHS